MWLSRCSLCKVLRERSRGLHLALRLRGGAPNFNTKFTLMICIHSISFLYQNSPGLLFFLSMWCFSPHMQEVIPPWSHPAVMGGCRSVATKALVALKHLHSMPNLLGAQGLHGPRGSPLAAACQNGCGQRKKHKKKYPFSVLYSVVLLTLLMIHQETALLIPHFVTGAIH